MQRPGIGLGCNATHSFDAIRFLTGRDVRRVTGWVDPPIGANPRGAQFVDPGGMVVMEMEQGADDKSGLRAVVAQIEDGAGPTAVEIDLTAARVRLDEKTGQVEIWERDTSVKPGPGRPAVFRQAEPPAGVTAKVDIHAGLRDLLANLISNEPLNAVHGRASIEVLMAAYLSARRGNTPVAVPSKDAELRELCLPIT
jgi:predicted dehydrogenase